MFPARIFIFYQVGMHDSTRSVQKKKEQLNASKRLLEEQEDEIMVNMLVYFVEFLYHVYRESFFFSRSYRCYVPSSGQYEVEIHSRNLTCTHLRSCVDIHWLYD